MTSTCRRSGCNFERETYTRDDGSTGLSGHCCTQCYVWVLRAKDADAAGNAREAAKLMRFAELLDGRESAQEEVPGLMRQPGKRSR